MDLLGQEVKDKNKGKKKMILALLITCTVLLVILITVMMILPKKPAAAGQYILNIDGTAVQPSPDTILIDTVGNVYISIKDIANPIGSYTYFDGGYQQYNQDKNECYVRDANQVIGFSINSNKIYKTKLGSMVYQPYTLKSNIISQNGKVYINAQDIELAFNTPVNFVQNGSNVEINISTINSLVQTYTAQMTGSGAQQMTISTDYNNQKAISYGMIVQSVGGKYGVVDTNLTTIIGNKYSSMTFDEYTREFHCYNR